MTAKSPTAPHRVVVTGMGVVSPVGCTVPGFLLALLHGKSGVREVTRFATEGLSTRIAAEVRLEFAELERVELKTAFAIRAARDAMHQASAHGNAPGRDTPRDGKVSMGLGLELFSMDDLAQSRREGFVAPSDLRTRMRFMQTPSDVPVHVLSARYGLARPPSIHVSACAAGTDAIGDAMVAIREGRVRWALAGGSDSMINPLGFAGFCTLDAMTRRNDEPSRASRPFDLTRDGFVLGEGAAVLVLERLDDARARGATVLAEVLGYGRSFDAYAITEPHPQGHGALAAMRRALDDAGILPSDLSAINAHGTSTPKNDPAESAAIRELLGERAMDVPVVSTKSMIGHLISAAGAVEAVAAVACMNEGVIHPTINLHQRDPRCDLDYVENTARNLRQTHVMSCSYGFGGMNAALVLGHADRL